MIVNASSCEDESKVEKSFLNIQIWRQYFSLG